MPDPSDEQLVRAFQNGDELAFGSFVKRHSDRVFRLATLWLRDPGLANDAAQETFLRTYTGIGRYRFRAKPTTWLLRILRNVCHEQNRKRAFVPIGDEMLNELHDGADAADDLDAEDRARRLRSAVGVLPERQRQVVTLRIFEELSVADTARVMGCREGTVKAHLNKAIATLRDRTDSGSLL